MLQATHHKVNRIKVDGGFFLCLASTQEHDAWHGRGHDPAQRLHQTRQARERALQSELTPGQQSLTWLPHLRMAVTVCCPPHLRMAVTVWCATS